MVWASSHPEPTLSVSAARYLNRNRRTWKPRTLGRKITAIRGWATWAGDPSVLANYKAPKPERPQPHPLPGGLADLLAMIDACGTNGRNRALVALCGLCGLRVSEALDAAPDDIDLDTHTILVRGKGDVSRVVPISDRAWAFIEPALEGARFLHFPTIVGLRESWARDLLTELGRKAGVKRPVSSHDLRATFATAAYDHTKDLRAVQELLGHASAKTTEVYTGVSGAAMRRAASF
jgi:integrase